MTQEISVRLESVMLAKDGEHMVVSASLPGGVYILNERIPVLGSREAIAAYLVANVGGYQALPGFTGLVTIELADLAEESASASSEASDDPNAGAQEPGQESTDPDDNQGKQAPADPPAADSKPKAVGVKDDAKGKSKGA